MCLQCRRHRRLRFDPWWARSPGRRNGNPLQYPCLENPMDRAWQATVHGVAKRWTWLMIIFGFFLRPPVLLSGACSWPQWYKIYPLLQDTKWELGSISGQEDPLEEGMATRSSILAWRIPWTEEPGLQSIWLHGVRHNWNDLAVYANKHWCESGFVTWD